MSDTTIKVMPTGPLVVTGSFQLIDAEGNPIPWDKEKVALCRCGASVNKPFCDGTHSKIGFLAAEAAVRQEES